MADMITRPIASAAERIAASTYFWGHTGSSPASDRRFAATDFVTKDPSGNAGVGTSSPSVRFHIKASSAEMFRLETQNARGGGNAYATFYDATGRKGYFGYPAASDGFFIANELNAAMSFVTNNVTRMVIEATGHTRPGADNTLTLGAASFRWSTVYAGSGSINTSDLHDKTDIEDIPDPLLDAWANVRWVLYRFKDGTRIHAGQVAQWVHKELEKAGIDAFAYGLVGKDEWEAETEAVTESVEVEDVEIVFEPTGKTVMVDGEECELSQRVEKKITRMEERDTGKTRVRVKAGDRWNLRPDECQAVEAAWNRREHKRLASRIDALEAKLAALEPAA